MKQSFTAKEEEIKRQKAEVAKLNEERIQELERISGLTSEQAKEYLLKTVEEDVKLDTAKLVKEMEHQAKEEAGKKAKEYVVTCDSEMRSRPCCRNYNFCCAASK